MSERSYYDVVLRRVKYVTFTCHKRCREEGPRTLRSEPLILRSETLPIYFEDESGRVGLRCDGDFEVVKNNLPNEVFDFS